MCHNRYKILVSCSSPAETLIPEPDQTPGEPLLAQRYRIIRELGSGGFGQTYVAEDTHHPEQARCVVKQFKPALQDGSFLTVARRLFASEVGVLRKLGSHDRIPMLLDDFEEEQQFYLVQEYIKGQPLSEELEIVQRLSEAEVIALLRDVLEVLEYVHRRQVIHRDIKPSNLIRRQKDGRFVVIDFGAVKELETKITSLEPEQTNATIGIGTKGYTPGEQLQGKPRLSSDIYALGMTAIQALTGIHPSQMPTDLNTGELVWRDRAQVSPWLAAILSKMVRYHFSQRFQTAGDVLVALDQTAQEDLTAADDDDTIVPDTVLAPTAPTPQPASTTLSKTVVAPPVSFAQDWRRSALVVGALSAIVTGTIAGLRQLNWLEPLELAAYDRMVQLSPDPGYDPRLLVVGITELDIQAEQRFPLSDRTVARLLNKLQTYQPRAIGVDLLRDIPQEPGATELRQAFQASNVVAITNLGNSNNLPTPAPPGVPPDRVGFNDIVLDADAAVRRNLMFADSQTATLYSFSLRLALTYLAAENVTFAPNNQNDAHRLDLGRATFQPIQRDTGGYANLDDRGYQILLKYRRRIAAEQVSVAEVMAGKVNPDWIRNRVVIIGTTASSGKDLFVTPYSPTEAESPRQPGVLLHAQMVSQLLSAALEGNSMIRFWPEGLELLWIAAWIGGSLAIAGWGRSAIVIVMGETILLVAVVVGGFVLFQQLLWVPIAAPALGIVLSAALFGLYQSLPTKSR